MAGRRILTLALLATGLADLTSVDVQPVRVARAMVACRRREISSTMGSKEKASLTSR